MAIELDHILVPVADVEASVRFYHQFLKLRYEPIALMRVSPTLVLQLLPRPPEASQHMAFAMSRPELDETLERLKGAEIPYGDNFDAVGNLKGPGKAHGSRKNGCSIYFNDPDGHLLEIICYETS